MVFRVRSVWVQIAAVTATAGGVCLAATACGGASSSAVRPAAPRPSSTVDPLAGVSASKVIAEATADAAAAPSVRLTGTMDQQGQHMTVDVAIKRGQGCAGSFGMGSQGTLKLIMIGKTLYLDPDKQFWTANGGAGASAAAALLNGRYLKVPASDKNMAGMADLCDVTKLIETGDHTFTKGAVTTLDGRRVLAIKVSDGSTDYVTDTSKPQFVESFAPKGTKDGSGKAIMSVGAPVTLAAPPASQVIDGTQLGM